MMRTPNAATILWLGATLLAAWVRADPASPAFKYTPEAPDQCFCQLKGHVDDCSCDVNTVDYFNNKKMFPRLQSLLVKDFFRYFEYNPSKGCQFFDDVRMAGDKCSSPRCQVRNCDWDALPPGLKGEHQACSAEPLSEPQADEGDLDTGSKVDQTLSDSIKKDIQAWKAFDASNQGFCEVDGGKNCKDCVFVDLTLNPERYTGYSGEAAHKIWRTIYEENCFRPPGTVMNKDIKTSFPRSPFSVQQRSKKAKASKLLKKFFVPQEQLEELCLEKRAFYRAVSGLHASITIHLSARYPKDLMRKESGGQGVAMPPPSSPFGIKSKNEDDTDMFGPNLELFVSRFDPEATEGQGPFWLKNLYFVYLLEMRAIQKAKPFLEAQTFFTGNEEEDKETSIAVKELLNVISSFPDHYDETRLFTTIDGEHSQESNERLKLEFREHFRNVSRVMDCVSCDKCKLWGKLQTTGLGTALKILFTDFSAAGDGQLSRNEVVALFNAFGRISTSIQQLENFREMLRKSEEKPTGFVTPMMFN